MISVLVKQCLVAWVGTGLGQEPQAPLPSPAGSTRAALARVPEMIETGVRWMIDHQNRDGSFGSHHSSRNYELIAAVPGTHQAYRVACTALGVLALSDLWERLPEDARAGADRAIDYLLGNYHVRRPNGLEFFNTWSFGYGLHAFGEWLRDHPEDCRAEAIRAACRDLVRILPRYQCLDGGFTYLDFDLMSMPPSSSGMSFTTATVMIGMERARAAGIEVPQVMIDKAVKHLLRSRIPKGSFLYGEYLKERPLMGINDIKGSACRNPANEYALGLCGSPIAAARRIQSLEDLLVRHTRFQRVASRRPVPHESWYSISGYFYLYGHAYAAYALEEMPEEVQERLWAPLVEALLWCREPDGSYWDYPVYSYHKAYGTAFALIALSRVPTPEAAH